MPSLAAARSANASFNPAYRPAAVFVGGTAGIGAGMARTLARILHGNVDIILVGRNGDAAAAVLASLTAPTSSGPGLGGDKDKPIRAFVRCDATLMRDVARAAAEIRALVQRVNFVVVSQAVLDFAAREETDEGIDRKSALFYYSRWKFIYELMPLMQAAADQKQTVSAMSVLRAGDGGKVDTSDFALKRNYVRRAFFAGLTYNDWMVESFAERHPNMAFMHAFPGGVWDTKLASSSTSRMLRILAPFFTLYYRLTGVTTDVCGEFMWSALLGHASGGHLIGKQGDELPKRQDLEDKAARELLWDHTLTETRST